MKHKLLPIIVLLVIVVSSWLAFHSTDDEVESTTAPFIEQPVNQHSIDNQVTDNNVTNNQHRSVAGSETEETAQIPTPIDDRLDQQPLPQLLPVKGVTIDSKAESSQRIVVPDDVVDAMIDKQDLSN